MSWAIGLYNDTSLVQLDICIIEANSRLHRAKAVRSLWLRQQRPTSYDLVLGISDRFECDIWTTDDESCLPGIFDLI